MINLVELNSFSFGSVLYIDLTCTDIDFLHADMGI